VEVYREGQRILERQRFQFPSSWLHFDNIEGDWGAFNEIIKRKDSSIQTQVQTHETEVTVSLILKVHEENFRFCVCFGTAIYVCEPLHEKHFWICVSTPLCSRIVSVACGLIESLLFFYPLEL
jgi:hypothetical protein